MPLTSCSSSLSCTPSTCTNSSTCTPSSTCTNSSTCTTSSTCAPSCTSTCTTSSSCTPSCSSTCTKSSTCKPSSCTKSSNCTSSSECSSEESTCETESSCTATCGSDTTTCDTTCESEYSTSGCSYTEEETCLGKKKYVVTYGKKCGHHMEDDIVGKNVIYINDHQTPVLKLTRGYTYYFYVKQKECNGKYDNTFVLTHNPAGKVDGIVPVPLAGSFDPVSHGCVKFHVSQCTPKYFYYQSSTNGFIGGLVVVQDDC